MKVLLVSDKEDTYIWDHFDPDRFKDVDFILSCGDLKSEYLSFLVTMVNKPLFYVPGNHDKTFVKSPPEGCTSLDGAITEYMGLRMVGFGGSIRYNKGDYQYEEDEMRKRTNHLTPRIWLKHGFDILVTHAPAKDCGDGTDLCHRGFECFGNLIDKYKPKYHIHGHNHLEYGMRPRVLHRGDTTVVNAFGYFILDTEKQI
jgi:uncharacterized protein